MIAQENPNTFKKKKAIKRFFVNSTPLGADVLANGEKIGITPCLISLEKGNHKIELHKADYLTLKKYLFIGGSGSRIVDTLEYSLKKTIATYIKSDLKKTDLLITNHLDTVLFKRIPAEIDLPFGRYKMELFNSERKCFKGTVQFNGQKKIIVPCYSKGTFEILGVDYFFSKPLLKNNANYNLYHLLATGQFGRFTILPGLSTSIVKVSIFQIDDKYKDTETAIVNKNTSDTIQLKYPNYISAVSLPFINAEFRVGFPLFRSLDICALGSYALYPKATKVATFNHVSGHDIFIGIELASRISICNVNIKIGSKTLSDISYNFYTKENKQISINIGRNYSNHYYTIPAKLQQFIVSIGFTLGQGKGYSNNMLRLFRKPVFTNY